MWTAFVFRFVLVVFALVGLWLGAIAFAQLLSCPEGRELARSFYDEPALITCGGRRAPCHAQNRRGNGYPAYIVRTERSL